MVVKSIAECSKGSFLQYFRPALSYNLLLRSLFCLFLSGRFTQILLYIKWTILTLYDRDTAILATLDANGLMWGSIMESKQTAGQVKHYVFC